MSLSNIKVNDSTVIGVDNEPTAGSDNLVKSGGVQEIIFNNSFLGKGTTYVESKIYGLIPGNTYRLWLEKTSWEIGTQAEDANIIDVGAYYNGERIKRYFHYHSSAIPFNPYYDIMIPENIDYLSVAGRASVGVRVRFTLEDITISNEIKSEITKINNINKVVTPIEVIGQGNTYIETELPDLKAGSSYIFNIPNWDKVGITEDTSPRLFSIQYYDSENVERLLVRVPTISLPDNSYYVNIPTDSIKVTMGTRLALNATVTIVISGADYFIDINNKINSCTDKVADNYSRILNSYFVGKDMSFVEQKFYGLIPGNTYRIYLEKTTWEVGTQSASANVIDCGAYYQGVRTVRYFHYYSSDLPLSPYYDIEIPADFDYLGIGGRAVNGVVVRFSIKDISDTSPIIKLIDSVELVGQGDTYFSQVIENTKPNATYRLIVSNWYKTGITPSSSARLFCISSYDTNNTETLIKVIRTDSDVNGSYLVTIPSDSTRVEVGGRLAQGTKAYVGFVNADYLNEQIVTENIISLNGGLKSLTDKFNAITKKGNESGNKIFSLLYFSDLHNNTTSLSRILEFKNTFSSYISDVLHGGDVVADQFYNDNPLANVDGGDTVLNVIGNHDNWDSSDHEHFPDTVNGRVSPVRVFAKFIAPYYETWGVTIPNGAAENGYCYWYKDYTDSKLRLVALDCMTWNSLNSTITDNPIQAQWLSDTLDEARTLGYAVIICEHFCPHRNWTKEDNTFSSICADPVTNWRLNNNAAAIVQEKINAQTNPLKFVCWLCGHEHKDFVGHLTDYPNQFSFCIDKAAPGSGWDRDTVRSSAGKTRDGFNIMSVDTTLGYMTIMRIGNNTDKFMRQKNYLVFDYLNSKIICNQ